MKYLLMCLLFTGCSISNHKGITDNIVTNTDVANDKLVNIDIDDYQWNRYYTDLKMPDTLGGKEWAQFGVIDIQLPDDGDVVLKLTDTMGDINEYVMKGNKGFNRFVISGAYFWKKDYGLPVCWTKCSVILRTTVGK